MLIYKEFFLLPNLISFFRLVLAIPACYLIISDFQGQNNLIIALVLCMYLSDLLDGYIARKYSLVSEFGKVIDPLADKLAVISMSICLLIIGKLPLWFIVVVVLRDVLILAFGIYLSNKKSIRLMSNFPGKLAVFSIGLILLLAVIDKDIPGLLMTGLYTVSIILILLSSYLYFKRYLDAVNGKI